MSCIIKCHTICPVLRGVCWSGMQCKRKAHHASISCRVVGRALEVTPPSQAGERKEEEEEEEEIIEVHSDCPDESPEDEEDR